ncbi:hypothetical protein GCM10025876_29010 [Demequina litorisediminis]|uniref:Uncharacterized protein n=1 Tax=Demequina litorisediminis TaxID=1849022 RepID=A0ABQ6IIY6_9MICO|nr:hypothetical protein GCM10025876_29010 [Demequina litorisediminis]
MSLSPCGPPTRGPSESSATSTTGTASLTRCAHSGRPASGSLFIPGIGDGTIYKYEVLGKDGTWRQKADPMARSAEVPPQTASIVAASTYTWGDEDWMTRRGQSEAHRAPMSVYEIHLGSWRQGLSLS